MFNSFFYIDWNKDAKHVRLTQSEYNDKFQWYKENGVLVDNRKGKGQRTGKQFWFRPWRYCVEQDHQQVNLYTSDGDMNLTVYYTMNDNTKCERDLGVSGAAAYRLVDAMFRERHDKSLQAAFGRCDKDFVFEQVNNALAPIIYTNEQECDYIQHNIFKADISSAYPYGLCFDLPDFHAETKKELAGIYPPTKEYPFAFYIKSGHMAIYNELDTYTDFRMHPLYCTRGKWRNDLYGEKDITVLCKASRFNLDDVMMELYDKKADDPNIKTMMVAFIGYIRSTKSWQKKYMGHLSACVYARHIKRMLSFYDAIVEDGNNVMMIPTDAICWQGHAMPQITTKEKRIGAFISEYENAKLLMLANGVYGIEVNGEIVCFKHQGTSVDEIKVDIKKLSDIKKLRMAGVNTFDPESKKFVTVDPIFHTKRDI